MPVKKLDLVERTLITASRRKPGGVTARELAEILDLDRSTASRYLNRLVNNRKAEKVPGRPVRYLPSGHSDPQRSVIIPTSDPAERFPGIVGAEDSLRPLLEEALAALLYPPKGLPILLYGETGVGKSVLARTLFQAARREGKLDARAPYVAFNCAEYAQNPELLMGQLFGVQKGAFTGAVSDRSGLVERADGGMLFLDEIHRLPPAGQEMLFYLIDQGTYRRLGETAMDRKARLFLIGATTEDPGRVLLPALYRRFSVKLFLPPLRERSRREREQLLDYFLREEAGQMGVPLSVSEECRHLFLTYKCEGNIGQLKSDVQIACARAFLRHLSRREDRVTIRKEDLPDAVVHSPASSAFTSPSFFPAPEAPREDASEDRSEALPNVYDELTRRKKEGAARGLSPGELGRELEQVVDRYVQTLHQASRKRLKEFPDEVRLISPPLARVLRETAEELKDDLPGEWTVHSWISLGLHIQSYMNRPSVAGQEHLPRIRGVRPEYRRAAEKIAARLQEGLGLRLPEREVDLITLLLAPSSEPARRGRQVAVLVAAHGEGAARSMAEVTNSLLGTPLIHSVDMPLNQPASVTFEHIRSVVHQIDQGAGVLMLVDTGSLTTMGEALNRETGIRIHTLTHVNLPMVIEAGRKAMLPENDLTAVAEAARRAASPIPPPVRKAPVSSRNRTGQRRRRIIATVCLTGEGAAVTLESWLREHLRTRDADVEIRSVRIDPQSRHSPLLDHLREEHNLIAVVGTVVPKLEGVPYVPAWELLQPEGINRLQQLLETTRTGAPVTSAIEKPVRPEEISGLVEQGLMETAVHLNPRLFCRHMESWMPSLRQKKALDPERELGLWMHLGVLTERLIRQGVTGEPISADPVPPSQIREKDPEESAALWEPLLRSLETAFGIEYPPETADKLNQLI